MKLQVMLLLCCCAYVAVQAQQDDDEFAPVRPRTRLRSPAVRARAVAASASVAASTGASINTSESDVPPQEVTTSQASANSTPAPFEDDSPPPSPLATSAQSERPPKRVPARPARPQIDDEAAPAGGHVDESECDDSDYDSMSSMFRNMAVGPIRHITSMMDDMFARIPNARGFDGFNNGASASAFSSSDGYERSSSAVRTNGRTRGIVSETRNGRTQTRRFGDSAPARRDASDDDEGDMY